MGAVFRWIKYIYEWCRDFAYALSGSGFAYRSPYDQGVQFYVDGVGGLDTNDGKSWAKAFQTITVACAAANALVGARGWVVGEYSTIWIRPGLYDEHDIGFPLFCHVIGLGIHGTDTMVEIHPTPGGVGSERPIFTGNSQGTHLANLWLETDDLDVAIIDAGVLSSALIEDCEFRKGTDGAGTIAIRMVEARLTEIRRCSFTMGEGMFDCAIHCTGPGGMFHACKVHDNDIFAARGIDIDIGSAYSVIKHNLVVAETGVGIDDGVGLMAYIVDNDIHAPADAINANAQRAIRNRVQEGAVASWEN